MENMPKSSDFKLKTGIVYNLYKKATNDSENEYFFIIKVFIIDAKYYGHNTQVQYNKNTVHSNNMYQIFTYVKNKEYELKEKGAEVSGMLLYAKTKDEIQPNSKCKIGGNTIEVNNLDMEQDFEEIKKQLNRIADFYFN